ncbi:hypothetical protein, partial [Rheinheimera sp.]|uniref:hypothetical protein n=1 Tax=Rheinheimera sp. TaxID=1869214 RepID=UPI0027BA4D40
MNLHTKTENLCSVLCKLRQLADPTRSKESLDSVFAAGDWSREVGLELAKITALNFDGANSLFR